jgi:hypothetical protein
MGTSPGVAQPNQQPEETKGLTKRKTATAALPTKSFVNDAWDEHDRGLQNRSTGFVLRAYGSLLAATMLIFFLQGFRLWGFHLEETTLHWLEAATIGQTAGLLTITIKLIFHNRSKTKR